MARISHQLAEHLEGCDAVVAGVYNLSKVFDTVGHKGLLAKFSALGVMGGELA